MCSRPSKSQVGKEVRVAGPWMPKSAFAGYGTDTQTPHLLELREQVL